jgi:hypothetical protein
MQILNEWTLKIYVNFVALNMQGTDVLCVYMTDIHCLLSFALYLFRIRSYRVFHKFLQHIYGDVTDLGRFYFLLMSGNVLDFAVSANGNVEKTLNQRKN